MFQTKIFQFPKAVGNEYRRYQVSKLANLFFSQKRQLNFLLNWFIGVFNSVDVERLRLVGPDCTCAEWLIRNGASVRFKGHPTSLVDYHELIKLEEAEAASLKVEEIYANSAGLNSIGFNHLKNCNHIKKITLIFCSHLDDLALRKLIYVKDSLQHLEVKSCFNIQDEGLKALQELKNLKTLLLADLFSVRNKDECEHALRKALPLCKIEFQKEDQK